MDRHRIIALPDTPDGLSSLNNLIDNTGTSCRIISADSLASLSSLLSREPPTAVILCDGYGDGCAPAQLGELLHEGDVPTILLSHKSRAHNAELLSAGLCPILCPPDGAALRHLLERAVEQDRVRRAQGDADARVEEFRALHDGLIESSGDAVAYLHAGLHVHANANYLDILGLRSPDELTALSLLEVMQGVDQDLREVLRAGADGDMPRHAIAVDVRRPDGELVRGEIAFKAARYQGEDCLQTVLRESDPRIRMEGELRSLRECDGRTGAWNRDAFMRQLDDCVRRLPERRAQTAVLGVRLDGIRALQETRGFVVADRSLANVAAALRDCLNDTDVLGQWTDELFLVLAHRDDEHTVEELARNLLQALNSTATQDHGAGTGRIGITPLMVDSGSADEMLCHARMACEQADGRERIAWYRPRLSMVEHESGSGENWGERLRHALESGGFYSVQQSIADLECGAGQLIEYRSFLRVEDRDFDQDVFLAEAHANRLGAEVDRAVLPDLLRVISKEPAERQYLVGISVCSMQDEGFTEWLDQQLKSASLGAHRLTFQVPVEAAARHPSRASAFIDALKSLGCEVALHGIGDEERHWQLACSLGLSLIRLSPVLVAALPDREETREALKQRAAMVEGRGIDVVADGVLDAAHLAALWQSGVRWVVGDYLQDVPQVVGQ